MNETKYILSLDISKKSTGLSIFEIEEIKDKQIDTPIKKLKLYFITSIKLKRADNYNKFYFLAKDRLLEEIDKIFLKFKLCSKNISVAIEAPAYGAYVSELQVYLTQEVLNYLYHHHINTVLYAPNTLKKFIKNCALKDSYKGIIKKNHINTIYNKYIYECNSEIVPETKELDDDSKDAFFLGLFGSLVQVPFLNYIRTIDTDLRKKDYSSFYEYYQLSIFKNPDYFSDAFIKSCENLIKYKGIEFGGDNYYKTFKDLFKALVKKEHMSLKNIFFYPFGYILEVQIMLKYHWQGICENSKKNRILFKDIFSNVPRDIFEIKESDINLGLNKKGELFFIL
jgi:hypothetical protein